MYSGPVKVGLAGLAALAVAVGSGRFAFTPMRPMMQADSGLSLIAGGWLASANYLGYLFGALSAGFFRRSGGVVRPRLLGFSRPPRALGITPSAPRGGARGPAPRTAGACALGDWSTW